MEWISWGLKIRDKDLVEKNSKNKGEK